MPAMPAWATTMSSLPNSAIPLSRAVFSWFASRTSAFAVTMPLPVFSTSFAVSSRSSGVAIGYPTVVEVLASVDRDDVGAFFCEPDRMTAPLPAGCARDECDLPLYASHLSLSFRYVFRPPLTPKICPVM